MAEIVRPYPTIPQLVADGAARNTSGVHAATKRGGRWAETSPAEFQSTVRRAALGFLALGVERGDRVAIHAEPSTEWLAADLALLTLGAIVVPIYPTQPGDQVAYILEHCGATTYVASGETIWARVASHVKGVATVRATVGLRGALDDTMMGWAELLSHGARRELEDVTQFDRLRVAVMPDDVATIIYTSGTTGLPKGVTLTHANLTSNVLGVLPRLPWDLEGERAGGRILSYLPLSHVFERMLSYTYQHIGYPIYFVEAVEEIAADLATVRPTHFASVPRVLEKMHAALHAGAATMPGVRGALLRWALALAGRYSVDARPSTAMRAQLAIADALVYRTVRERLGGRLRAITVGGAALSAPIMNFFNAIGIFCAQGYGMTETSPVVTVYEPKRLRAGSIGTPIEHVEIHIADDGELLVRGPNVMRGYYASPEQTADVLKPDGWLCTGDIVTRDADGFLFITDRKKDLLKLSTGKYVAPQPIETQLAASPLIEQAVVIGNGLRFCSALIVPDPAELARLGVDAIRPLIQADVDAANRTLAPWEQVKKFSLVTTAWTIADGALTPTLKVKRRVITERHRAEIEAMYA